LPDAQISFFELILGGEFLEQGLENKETRHQSVEGNVVALFKECFNNQDSSCGMAQSLESVVVFRKKKRCFHCMYKIE
jgi:hypothetical protein